jgi:hypothetical protein
MVAVLGFVACTTGGGATRSFAATCADGIQDGDETGVDCGGSCGNACITTSTSSTDPLGDGGSRDATVPVGDGGDSGCATCGDGGIDGIKDGQETDVDCGGPTAPKCGEGKSCKVDADCEVACNYANTCVSQPSCKPHLGGDTCGVGEVGADGAMHESCCRSLLVSGYDDPSHPGKTVYVDKYEITAGRVRAWIAQLAAGNKGHPDVKTWIKNNRPMIWDDAWNDFLPTDYSGGTITIGRRLLGDPRPEDNDAGDAPPGPGVILPPPTDQTKNLGVNFQFGTEVYVDLHGSDCGSWDGSYGFATYWYPPTVLARDNELPRADGLAFDGSTIPAQDLLDVKPMNCITNAMLAAFCAWDGGQLATDEVLDYITATPPSLGYISGCGTQYDDHGALLGNDFSTTVRTGGRCPDVVNINATFDAGDNLPVPGSILNVHNYHYPDLGNQTFDKAWEVSAPGRGTLAPGLFGAQVDAIRINPTDEPWMDLAGNLSEAAFDMSGSTFTGLFTLKYRGIGYGSARSDLNITLMRGESILRIQRPEAKAAFTGGRCMRFK